MTAEDFDCINVNSHVKMFKEPGPGSVPYTTTQGLNPSEWLGIDA